MEIKERIAVLDTNIVFMEVDAIVNAANTKLRPGAGVCGAIHDGAGPELAKECAMLGSCGTGKSVITRGFDLPAAHVIHTVGPVWRGGEKGEADLLAACHRSALDLAARKGLVSVAFPAISTGIFGYPMEQAAAVAMNAVCESLKQSELPKKVFFACFGTEAREIYQAALDQIP